MNSFVAGHEIDAYWEDARFGVEIDVYATHGSRVSFEADRVRDDDFLHAGIETTRRELTLAREASANAWREAARLATAGVRQRAHEAHQQAAQDVGERVLAALPPAVLATLLGPRMAADSFKV